MAAKHYTGNQVAKAGKAFLDLDRLLNDDEEFNRVMDVLSFWRLCHEQPLDHAWEVLQEVSKKHDASVILAKRLKRYASIHKKLVRFQEMSLKGMQDIGGCRAIFANEKRLTKVVRDLRRRAAFKTPSGKIRSKDYIKNPKPDGYRSYHLVGRFPNADGSLRNIEIQLRTRLQHYWATALEIVDLFTGQALKSNQGDEQWETFFAEVSRQFSIMDKIHMFKTLKPAKQFNRYSYEVDRTGHGKSRAKVQRLYKSLKIEKKFTAYAGSISVLDKQFKDSPKSSYVLLRIDTQARVVNSKVFAANKSKNAEAAYIQAEKDAAQNDDVAVALVSSASVGGIREAYPNFFADSTEFLKHLSYVVGT